MRTREWELLDRWYYHTREGTIFIDRGFRFNLASIPRPMWWIVGPHELSIAAPLLHDFLYSYMGAVPFRNITPYRTFSREEADALFHAIMLREGVPKWKASAALGAVDMFGGGAWAKGGKVPFVGGSLDLGRRLLLEGVKLVGPSDFTVTLPNEWTDTYE